MEKKYGLLGRTLSHSYSKKIHNMLGSYNYDLFPVDPEDIEKILRQESLGGLNVTIPYKQTVLAFCDDISNEVLRIGAANTLVNKDGKLCAYNTDIDGFRHMVYVSGIKVAGKKVLVLGSGGASKAVVCALQDLAAKEIVVISREGDNNYENLHKHSDAEIIVNTTPVGMYPNNLQSPVDLRMFPHLCGVLDIIYNPQRTALLLQADKLSIPNAGGLHMLVAQAKVSSELFTGKKLQDSTLKDVTEKIREDTQNIILIGMPGCGKTEIGRKLSELTGKECINTDTLIERKEGKSIPKIFEENGEDYFRKLEHKTVLEVSSLSGKILSLGGGAVTTKENLDPLRQNGVIFYIDRDINLLPRDGRPLSTDLDALKEMYTTRLPMYEAFMDKEIKNNGTLMDAVEKIREIFYSTSL